MLPSGLHHLLGLVRSRLGHSAYGLRLLLGGLLGLRDDPCRVGVGLGSDLLRLIPQLCGQPLRFQQGVLGKLVQRAGVRRRFRLLTCLPKLRHQLADELSDLLLVQSLLNYL